MPINQLKSDLLTLHKALLDEVKKTYEETHGAIANPGVLFRLVVEDQAFQWLRPLSETIVAIDEALETDPPASPKAIIGMVHDRLFPETPTELSMNLENHIKKSSAIKTTYEAIKQMMK